MSGDAATPMPVAGNDAGLVPALRTRWRLVRVGVHLGYGLAVAAVVYPLVGRPLRLSFKQRWSRQLLGMLGVRLQAPAIAPMPALLVANHVSWLDIFAINAASPAAFVCKADVRNWPLIGWLCERAETVFMPRDSRRAAHEAGGIVAARLRQGWQVAVFPEGTTSDGTRLLPFHGALLQGAIDADCPVQPLALCYLGRAGQPSLAAAYSGDTTLLQSLCRIAATPGLHVRLDVLPPIDGRGAERRALAAAAQAAIRHSLHGNGISATPAGPDGMAGGVRLAAA